MEKKNKIIRNVSIVVIVLVLMALIVFLVGRSFGFFQYAKHGDTVNVITINGIDVTINNNSEEALNLQDTYPMYDSDGLLQTPFEFTIENTSKRAIDYTLKIENDAEKQSECTLSNNDPCPELATSYIKYAYKIGNGSYSTPQLLSTTNGVILSETILGKQSKDISLLLWIDSSAGNDIQGKYFFGQLVIEGSKSALVETTIYSAAMDEVYYYDSNNEKVVLGTTDATGKLENILLPAQSITLYSSIAKDPSNLSNPYSKLFTPSNITNQIYLMPDNTIYWYGNEMANITGGWDNTTIEGGSDATGTKETNYFHSRAKSTTSMCQHRFITSNVFDLTNYTTMYVIADGYTNGGYAALMLEASPSKTQSHTTLTYDTYYNPTLLKTTPTLVAYNVSNYGDNYYIRAGIGSGGRQNIEIYVNVYALYFQ